MKKLLILLLFYNTINAQFSDYAYVRFQLDPNNLFGIIDNPRTEVEILGFDFDFEIGARDRHIGVYLTYGRFEKQGYQNYAAGVDYYPYWFENHSIYIYNPISGVRSKLIEGFDLSVGINYGLVSRKYHNKFEPGYNWGGSGAMAMRGVIGIKFSKNISIINTLQYQQRPELKKFVLEGAIGIQFSI